jgi:hypothetical protein
MEQSAGLDLLVNESDRGRHRLGEAPVPALADGQVLFRVDRFAFTANNVSHALAADMLDYWRLLPAPACNRYDPTEGDALYQLEHEDALTLMRGLFPISLLAGRTEPQHGRVLSLWDAA